ncbi:hypothetical protein EYV94_05860 [Puteibacter caeruleilacunae]|nr:hypothetical protein EYV94_05860 [Puteibacter caeruleilacunae]
MQIPGKILQYIVIVLLFLEVGNVCAQNVYHTGLLFQSAPTPKEQRTSINLTHQNVIIGRKQIGLSFDISFWDSSHFGYVFRLVNETNENIDLVYTPPRNREAFLKIIYKGTPTNIIIPLPADQIIRNKWFNFDLKLDLSYNTITVIFDDVAYYEDSFGFEDKQRYKIIFGANHTGNFQTSDVPSMGIRNIKISDRNEKVIYNWLLDEAEGNIARDLVGGVPAEVSNPYWLINDHYFWKKQAEFYCSGLPGFIHDKENNDLVVVTDEQLSRYDILNSKLKEQSIKATKTPPTKDENNCLYIPEQRRLLSFSSIPGRVKELSTIGSRWNSYLGKSKFQYHNANIFFEKSKGQVMSIGGYTNFNYRNHILSFSEKSKTWERFYLNGDYLVPRYYSSIGEAGNPGAYYLFGGYGNQSGQQELGPRCLYDLYYLNFNDTTISKVWEIQDLENNFIPTSNLVVNESKGYLYTLGFPPFLNATFLRLYRLSLSSPSYTVVSDTIHYFFDEEISKAKLFYSDKTSEFYAMVSKQYGNDTSKVSIYRLTYPPVNQKNISFTYNTILNNPEQFPQYIYYIVLALIPFLVGLFIFFLRQIDQKNQKKKKKKKKKKAKFFIDDRNQLSEKQYKELIKLKKKNAVYLFGEFRVFNNQSEEITSRFSPKLKQLFLAIMLHTFERENGISSKSINKLIWPYHTPQSAKNNRSVNIKKLRSILEDIEGMEIIYEDNHWTLRIEKPAFCDLDYILKKLRNKKVAIKKSTVDYIIKLLARGKLLPDSDFDWIHQLKTSLENQGMDYLFDLAHKVEYLKNPEITNRISKSILAIDPINEEGYKLRILSLIGLKNHSQAKAEFQNFTKEYKDLYDEPYPNSYKEFIGSLSDNETT